MRKPDEFRAAMKALSLALGVSTMVILTVPVQAMPLEILR